MAASRTFHGVTKSGSPTPSEMTPSIEASRSKKRRMPEAGIACTRSEISPRRAALPSTDGTDGMRSMLISHRHGQAVGLRGPLEDQAVDLVALHDEVGRRALDRGQRR